MNSEKEKINLHVTASDPSKSIRSVPAFKEKHSNPIAYIFGSEHRYLGTPLDRSEESVLFLAFVFFPHKEEICRAKCKHYVKE